MHHPALAVRALRRVVGRLKNLGARVQVQGPRLAEPAAPGTSRADAEAGRGRAYDKRKWRDGVRPQKLRQDPLCAEHLENGSAVAATEVDHVDGDSSNNAPANLRSLCKACHSAKTARENGSFGNARKQDE